MKLINIYIYIYIYIYSVNNGVKQDDPMSPLLFNIVTIYIDYATSDVPNYIRMHNNKTVKYMASADDLIL